jgi:isopentenyl-diphosphate Delta-isomerase
MSKTSNRKNDHIQISTQAQIQGGSMKGLNYEPLWAGLEGLQDAGKKDFTFLDKRMCAPLWISSMTGGGKDSSTINRRLAQAVAEFGLGMGLGSCRPLLQKGASKKIWQQFDLRPILGADRPLWINLGVAQIETLLHQNEVGRIENLAQKLRADGLIIHVNPLQEFLQPEGDRYRFPAIETIGLLLQKTSLRIMVKEVGQGMGPRSVNALLQMPLQGLEFGAYGGTNFAQLEILRQKEFKVANYFKSFSFVGHTAEEMVELTGREGANLGEQALCRDFIISGGIRDIVYGYYLGMKLWRHWPDARWVIGQAYPVLQQAQKSYQDLCRYIRAQIEGVELCQRFLTLR